MPRSTKAGVDQSASLDNNCEEGCGDNENGGGSSLRNIDDVEGRLGGRYDFRGQYRKLPVTWEEVDDDLMTDLRAKRTSLKYKTNERRLFAFMGIYNYLYNTLTIHLKWCPTSTVNFLREFNKKINDLRRKVAEFKGPLDEYQSSVMLKNYNPSDIQNLLAERHAELTNPDMKIWKTLFSEGLVQERVKEEYEKVRHLLPNEPIFRHEPRHGSIHSLINSNEYNKMMEYENVESISALEFFNQYVKSDESVTPSNRLSKMFSVPFEVLPNITVRVPRRTERFFNGEILAMSKLCAPTTSNYTRGLVLSYLFAKMLGSSYMGAQIYMKTFAEAAQRNSPFFTNAKESITTSYSRIKLVLKTPINTDFFKTEMTYPATFISSYKDRRGLDSLKNDRAAVRRFLMNANKYLPSGQDKNAVAFLRTPISEHNANGPLAEWLAINMSKIIGRKVDAQYSLLLLVNWAARSDSKSSSMLLKRVSNTLNVFFHHPSGIVVPNIGFGTGMTDVKLKVFAKQLIEHMIKPLVMKGRGRSVLEESAMDVDDKDYDEIVDIVGCEKTCELARENKDIVIASSKLLANNDVFKHKPLQLKSNNGNTQEDIKCDCECHGVGRNLAGLKFHPCEERRLIYEQEYSKLLYSQPYLLAEFGVCGYQHRLTASSDKKTLVSLQLLKERLIYTQREAAAAINWSRLLQFFLTSGSARDINNVQEKLYSMNRKYIEHFSTFVRNGIACDRIISDLITKFNAEILPLGRGPDSFIRTKAGLTIIDHATQVLTRHYHDTSQIEKIRDINVSTIPRKLMEAAERCVTGRDLRRSYNVDKPFLVPHGGDDDKRFKPIPFFGVHNPIYPTNSNEYEDNTAQKCSNQKSEFWIKANEINTAEALVSKGVISLPKMVNNIESSRVIFSENNKCRQIFEGLDSIFKKDVSIEKPRKQDDHTPWSSKNTGQSGRNTTEFSINSVMVVADYENGINGDPEDDIFLSAVDNQRITAQNDMLYPEKKKHHTEGFNMIKAPDYAPVYRHGGKTSVIILK